MPNACVVAAGGGGGGRRRLRAFGRRVAASGGYGLGGRSAHRHARRGWVGARGRAGEAGGGAAGVAVDPAEGTCPVLVAPLPDRSPARGVAGAATCGRVRAPRRGLVRAHGWEVGWRRTGGGDAGERAADVSGDDRARRGDGDGDDAQANDDHTGIEHVRVARGVLRVLLGPRTVGNDNPKLKQRGNDATSDGECFYWKRKSTP